MADLIHVKTSGVAMQVLGPDDTGRYTLRLSASGESCEIDLGVPRGMVETALLMAASVKFHAAAIAALPAQGVRVPEVEERKFYHDEWPLTKLLDARDLGNGLLTDDGEAWRYRLTHFDARGKYDVLYRPIRKIAALAPAEAGGVEATDPRPANCRFRLQDEGKSYPRSSCQACGATITTGLGKACRYAHPATARPNDTPAPVDALVKAAARVVVKDATPDYPGRYAELRQTIDGLRAALAAIRGGRNG